MRRAALLLVVLAMPGAAHAFAGDPSSYYSNGKSTVSATATNPNWQPTVSGSGYKVSRDINMAAPAGKTVPTSAYTTLTKPAARQLMTKALKVLPVLGTGIALWEFWQDYGVRPDGQGGLEKDPGESAGEDESYPAVAAYRLQVNNGGVNFDQTGPLAQRLPMCQALQAARVASGGGPFNPATVTTSIPGVCNNTFTSGFNLTAAFSAAGYSCPNGGSLQGTTCVKLGSCRVGVPRPTDGLCPTDIWIATGEEYAEQRIADYPPPSAEELAALDEALNYVPYAIPDAKPWIGPTPNVGNTVQVVGPNGTTTTTDTYTPDTSQPGEVEWTKTTTKTNPDGTTETTTGDDKKQIEPCGLPNTPKCVIEEKGTPEKADLVDATTAIENAHKGRQDQVAEVSKPDGKNTAWTFTLALPTGCTALNVDMRYKGMGQMVNLDPCQAQGVMHDLMSLLWSAGTIFVVAGMFGRTLREV